MRRAASSSVARSQPRSSAAAAARSWLTGSSERSKAGRDRRSWARRAKAPPTARTARTIRTMTSQCGTGAPLQHDVAGVQVRADLALDALEGVVDGLAVAAELLADGRVRAPIQVQREHARLQLGQHGRQARDQ